MDRHPTKPVVNKPSAERNDRPFQRRPERVIEPDFETKR
jgi:hypothetical protein